jgi:methylated-DNA-[protein]-cysteine S-methyltransferase
MAEAIIETPIGPLYAVASAAGLERLEFVRGTSANGLAAGMFDGEGTEGQQIIAETEKQLEEYFDGDRREFDLPLAPSGSDFQMRVWQAIAAIPYGEVLSYGELAIAAGSPGAFRAAGSACGNNKLTIVIPCHRVVGANRHIGGYGGGLSTKIKLLHLEGSLEGLKGVQPSLIYA